MPGIGGRRRLGPAASAVHAVGLTVVLLSGVLLTGVLLAGCAQTALAPTTPTMTPRADTAPETTTVGCVTYTSEGEQVWTHPYRGAQLEIADPLQEIADTHPDAVAGTAYCSDYGGLAIFVNGIRIFMTGFLVFFVDPKLGEGFMHLTEGYLLFLISLSILALLTWMFLRVESRFGGKANA